MAPARRKATRAASTSPCTSPMATSLPGMAWRNAERSSAAALLLLLAGAAELTVLFGGGSRSHPVPSPTPSASAATIHRGAPRQLIGQRSSAGFFQGAFTVVRGRQGQCALGAPLGVPGDAALLVLVELAERMLP